MICALLAATISVLVRVLPHDGAKGAPAADAAARRAEADRPRDTGPAAFLLSQLAVFKDARVRLNASQILLSMAGLYVYYTYLNPLLVQVIGVPEAASVSYTHLDVYKRQRRCRSC